MSQAARSFYAKDREQAHRAGFLAPGSNAPHLAFPFRWNSGILCVHTLMSCTPVTVARLRRIRTDFPIMPEYIIEATR
jgi:hypothetical protein